ncbi:hypothetical protein [Tepidibacter formicigenes]|jgi:hypothetical protein|uniref:Bacteriophage holin of superfamily 6 (Holin_LLH) n=1 Tax=Tepidibacter formicigenes DSM 15518 TaxID=1123349 RepID=A0A1M6Q2L0_9FIRM|nr:hypothetical protein [Tepidibacter formicigenes]SHK14440.1 hypothetical protein SAMN02744037_01726 [Tepidibacter formicigenes DSM 15518]
MAILNFLFENWDSVLVAIGFIALVVVLIKRGETKILNNILYKLVTQAEREFGAGTGELKYAAVSDWIYERLPAILKFLFTSKDIDRMIESTLEMAKQKWESNENLKMYINNEEKILPEIKTE